MNVRIILLSLLAIMSCSDQEIEREIQVTESEVLNEFVRRAPVQFIVVDTTATETISLIEEDIIFDTGDHDKTIGLGRLSEVITVGNHFYAWSFGTNRIHRIDMEGKLSGPYGSIGKGPGEYSLFADFGANDSLIFMTDLEDARINYYDHDMNFIDQIDGLMVDNISLNNDYIVFNSRWSGRGFNCDGFILSRHKIGNMSEKVEFMPCIIPSGYQPSVHNNAVAKINNNNEVTASYNMLPWMSVFDADLNLSRTLIIEDPRHAELGIVPIEIRKPNPERNPGGVGGSVLLSEFIYLDNGDLIIQNRDILHLKKEQDGSYSIKGNYKLLGPDGEYQWIKELHQGKNSQLFASNWDRIYKINLPE